MTGMPERPASPPRPARRARVAAAGALALVALAAAGCGNGAQSADPEPVAVASATPPAAAPSVGTPGAATNPTAASTQSDSASVPRDSEESASFPLPSGQKAGKDAPHPTAVKDAPIAAASDAGGVSPGAPSDAEIQQELLEMKAVKKAQASSQAPTTGGAQATVNKKGTAAVPANAPETIARVIAGGNAIAHFPYIWGGGHGSFVDNGYDCSGSVSYALASGGLLRAPLVSGELASYGDAGPGKWITIYANETHTFMYVAGLRFDTSGRDGVYGSRWQTAPRSLAGFSVRHPPGF
jgi:cell wall-associated NlpC family hydrolase